MAEILTGGCLCGAVRYRITGAPVETLHCHCRMCWRAHGAPFVAWPTVPLDAFAVTAGNPVAHRSSAKAFRHFCGSCSTPLTWRETDDAPLLHLWTDSRIPRFDTADHLPRFPTNQRPKPVF